MWLVIFAVVCVVVFVWATRDGNYSDAAEFFGMGGILGLAITGLLGLVAVVNLWEFQPDMAKMRQVRLATERLGCLASEDVVGKAADWNQETESNKLWNRRWLADPFIPDGWDSVTVIVIPDCRSAK